MKRDTSYENYVKKKVLSKENKQYVQEAIFNYADNGSFKSVFIILKNPYVFYKFNFIKGNSDIDFGKDMNFTKSGIDDNLIDVFFDGVVEYSRGKLHSLYGLAKMTHNNVVIQTPTEMFYDDYSIGERFVLRGGNAVMLDHLWQTNSNFVYESKGDKEPKRTTEKIEYIKQRPAGTGITGNRKKIVKPKRLKL